jgi:hypothetical protein
VTSVANDSLVRTYRVSVQAPAGYKVTVTPSTFSLKKGDSVTYQVDILNKSAPIGAWRFGSLTWHDVTGGQPWPGASAQGADWSNGGEYSVRSPIAVRGSRFDAPARVSGQGTSGSVAIPVRFGYTGAYNARSRGLVAATVNHATVAQDPDQTFDPGDTGHGATVHSISVNDVYLFRIALPPDSVQDDATDLDVYVFDPSGDFYDASFVGGTDELIDIVNPQNGTWKVYVHGWQTAGPSDTYDLYTWRVPRAGGGSLVLGSKPSSAKAATVGIVTANWTGAAAGKWYLGIVQHVGPSGSVMGQTLVEVDNR